MQEEAVYPDSEGGDSLMQMHLSGHLIFLMLRPDLRKYEYFMHIFGYLNYISVFFQRCQRAAKTFLKTEMHNKIVGNIVSS